MFHKICEIDLNRSVCHMFVCLLINKCVCFMVSVIKFSYDVRHNG